MKILVYGVGAIGSLLVHYLCEAGNDVTVAARSTYSQLKQNGLEIRHYLQRNTTVDHPKIVKQAEDTHYDIVFSVMQGNQQIALLPTLAALDTNLIVLVGNNLETEKCKEALRRKRVLYGFQDSAGHREGALAVVGRLPETVLTIGRLYSPASSAELRYVRKAFGNVKGYRVQTVDSMYAYYLYHVAEIMPYCYLCYRLDFDLKRADRSDIRQVMQATDECFAYLKAQQIPVMPPDEDSYYSGGIKTSAMQMLYRIMAKTVLGRLMVSDHCQNGIGEMCYLDERFAQFREAHPGCPMPTWDAMRKQALPVLQGNAPTGEYEAITSSYRQSRNIYDDVLTQDKWWSRLYIRLFWSGVDDNKIAEKVLRYIPNDFAGALLDVPVGTAVFTHRTYKALPEAQITCLDYSEDMLSQAKRRLGGQANVTLMQGDVGHLPFQSGAFDVVLSMNGFHAFPDKRAAFRETYRVLKRGGRFIGCFYIQGESAVTDQLVRQVLVRKGWFTPPFDTAATLRRRLEKVYDLREFHVDGSMVYFCAVKK